jgi:hypothetical protein
MIIGFSTFGGAADSGNVDSEPAENLRIGTGGSG